MRDLNHFGICEYAKVYIQKWSARCHPPWWLPRGCLVPRGLLLLDVWRGAAPERGFHGSKFKFLASHLPLAPIKTELEKWSPGCESSETEKCSESLSFSNKTRTRGYSVHTRMLGWLEGPGQKATHHARARTGKVGSGPEGQGSCPGPVSFRLVTLGAL